VRAYREDIEEALRARRFLKDWAGEGYITSEQYRRMEQETVCELRTVNIFLRVVLFLFTVIIVGAAVGLFFVVFLSHPSDETSGIFLIIFAGVSYAAAEIAVAGARLYRYGIEEALAACSVGFLCVGIQLAFFGSHFFSSGTDAIEVLVPATGALVSLWIWHRFGFPYAFLAAMVFVVYLPGYWTPPHAAQRIFTAAIYAVGLIVVAAVRGRYLVTYLDRSYSIAEALLWIGIYLAFNLQISPLGLRGLWLGAPSAAAEFARPFYWTTFVTIWFLPPAILVRGVRTKDRYVIAAGAIGAVLTLVTNKPYLGWERRTWDPMLLGALFIGVALYLRRWLAAGTDGTRDGFTARRLSGKDKELVAAGAGAVGMASPYSVTPAPQPEAPGVHFGGGDSGGGGATSDF